MTDILYIDGTRADLSGGSGIYLTYRSNIFGDISKIVGDNSNTITLPKTERNLAILGVPILPSNTTTTPYRTHTAQVYRDGLPLFESATLVILSVKEDGIEVAITWGVTQALQEFITTDKTLNDLDYSLDTSTDYALWSADHNGRISQPKAYYGLASDETDAAYHPVCTINYILNKIQSTNGVTFSFGSTPWYDNNWVMPVLNRVTDYVATTYNTGALGYLAIDEYRVQYDGDYDYYRLILYGEEQGSAREFDSDYLYWRTYLADDTTGMYATLYALPLEKRLQFRFTGEVQIEITGTYEQAANCRLVLGSLYLTDLYSAVNEQDELMEISPYLVSEYSTGVYHVTFLMDGEESDIVNIDHGSTNVYSDGRCLNLYVKFPNDATLSTTLVESTSITWESRIGEIQVEGSKPNPDDPYRDVDETYVSLAGALAGHYPFIPNLPNLGQIKFLKAVMQMGCLFAFLKNNTIHFEPFSVLDTNKTNAYDWSDYLIARDVPQRMEFTQGDEAQRNNMLYGEGEDTSVTAKMDSYYTIDNTTLDYERDAVELPFKSYGRLGSYARFPMYTYEEEEEDGTTTYTLEWDLDKNPYVCEMYGSSNSLVDYYITNVGVRWEDLLAEYYTDYVDALNRAKVLTETFVLKPLVLKELDMRYPVYLRQYGCYFAIVEIKTKENNLAEVKLIKI